MFASCLFCNSSLGANESIEAFPVGRRLAFDAKKGRLWVVCERCSRWNLSPVDARFNRRRRRLQFAATSSAVAAAAIGVALAPTVTPFLITGTISVIAFPGL